MRPSRLAAVALVALLLCALAGAGYAEDPPAAAPAAAPQPVAPPKPPRTDPRDGEVPLPAPEGWHASLVLDNDGVGIWTVESYSVFEQLGCPEVVGLDDKGRCHVLMSYSGRWTPISVIHEGKWLGGLTHGDVDPRVPGAEVYAGSQRGTIFQVRAYGDTALDARRIARIEGREIHTLVCGDLDPRSPGSEVIVFTRPGGLYRLSPTGPEGGFVLTKLMDLPGRVRQALVLPSSGGAPPAIATVARTGRLALLTITEDGPAWTTIHRDAMGMGRLALAPASTGAGPVLYATHDDGRILRAARGAGGAWRTEVIYHGPLGPRGVVAGPFDEDPAVETVAVFGYSGKVELLTRGPEGWRAETIFEDRDKGHWLAVAELDGRNGTREILTSGYSGRIVLLSRPPGYGRAELATTR